MGDLSARLSRREFACRCGCGFATVDIANIPVLEDLADHFQTKYMGERCFIIINSGCRCREYNEAVQKKAFKARGQIYVPYTSKSRHMWGDAIDFYLVMRTIHADFKVNPLEVYDYLDNRFSKSLGLGRYVAFTHLDQGPRRRW